MKAMHAQTHNLPDISFDWTMHIGDTAREEHQIMFSKRGVSGNNS